MYRKGSHSWIQHFDFLLVDLVCLHISYIIFFFAAVGHGNPYGKEGYPGVIFVVTFMDVLIMIFLDMLRDVQQRGYYKEFIATVKHIGLLSLFSVCYMFLIQENDEYQRLIFVLLGISYFFLSYIVRCIWKKILNKKAIPFGNRLMLIVTTQALLEDIINDIEDNVYGRYRIAGIAVIDRDMHGQKVRGIRIVANRSNLISYVSRNWVDEVFLNLPRDEEKPHKMVEMLGEMGIVTHLRLFDSETLVGNRQLVEMLGNCIVLTNTINYATPAQLFIKRLMDIAVGLLGCVLAGLIAVFVAPLIYIKSPGPVIFSQIRVGENGKRFKIYKFRSMYMDAEKRKNQLQDNNIIKDGLMFKMDDDPRIIGYKRKPDGTVKKGIGNFLRDTSLDEFPQFFNVLKGDMSLVGTRPPTLDEWEKYEPHHRARMATKPGITGMWQVSGRSKITDFEEVVKLDTQYIRNWSIGQDIKILIKTVGIVLKKDGSM